VSIIENMSIELGLLLVMQMFL